MPKTKKYIEGVGDVEFFKRRGTRSIRIRLRDDGSVRVTMPLWSPYRAAIAFVKQQSDWIAQRKTSKSPVPDGSSVGTAHTVTYISSDTASKTIRTRVTDSEIRVYVPGGVNQEAVASSEEVYKAGLRALKSQAQSYLVERTWELSNAHDFKIKEVKIKIMRSRWGSCSSQGTITLNAYLMQLAPEYRDYVILHELTHTKIPNHSAAFWAMLSKYVPDVAQVKKHMKHMPTQLVPTMTHE